MKSEVLNKITSSIRKGLPWILLPTLLLALSLLFILIFIDPSQRGTLHAKFILLYAIVGG